MYIKTIAVFLTLFSLLDTSLISQEHLGLVTGNYAGINGITINPSSAASSKLYMDVNILSAGVFHQNNYLYMKAEDYSFFDFFTSGYEFPMHPEEGVDGERPFYLFDNNKLKKFHTYMEIIGPSFMISRSNFSYGFFSRMRVINNVLDFPPDMANYFYYGLGYQAQRNIRYEHKNPYIISILAYSEFGLNFSYTFKGYRKDMLSLGGSAKILLGHAGIYYKGGPIDYMIPDGETINIYDYNANISYAVPIDYESNNYTNDNIQGKGIAIDLGITYQKNYSHVSQVNHNKPCLQRFEPYKYKLGFSIIDMGKIWFKGNAKQYNYVNDFGVWNNVDSVKKLITNPESLVKQLNLHFCGSEDCVKPTDKFFINTPAAVSLQFDYHIKKSWYVNVFYLQDVPIGAYSIHRPAVLAIIPRYESRIFELAMPVSLYDYTDPRIGLSMRFHSLTIGTEKLLGFFSVSDFSGLDLYVGIKISLEKGYCGRSRKDIPCYDQPRRRSR